MPRDEALERVSTRNRGGRGPYSATSRRVGKTIEHEHGFRSRYMSPVAVVKVAARRPRRHELGEISSPDTLPLEGVFFKKQTLVGSGSNLPAPRAQTDPITAIEHGLKALRSPPPQEPCQWCALKEP